MSGELEQYKNLAQELSETLHLLRPLAGSESVTFVCGKYYADPAFYRGVITELKKDARDTKIALAKTRKALANDPDPR